MPRKFNASQFKSQIRQAENKAKRDINREVQKYNSEVNKYNRNVEQAVNNYNRAVRQHNATVMQNRSKIQSELRKLNLSNSSTTAFRTSVFAVNESYQNVSVAHDNLVNPTPFQEYVFSSIEQENANNLETANVIIDDVQPTTSYSLQDTKIMHQLSSISTDLDSRWKGALFSLNPSNPDAARHFCTSAREIFTQIFDSQATDADVFALFPDCDKTPDGKNATRKSKIRYFLHKKGFVDVNVEDFIENNIDNILKLFNILSAATHGKAGKYTSEKLATIKKRVEDGLVFLCDIAA